MSVFATSLHAGGEAKDDADTPGSSPRDGCWAGAFHVKEGDGRHSKVWNRGAFQRRYAALCSLSIIYYILVNCSSNMYCVLLFLMKTWMKSSRSIMTMRPLNLCWIETERAFQ